MFGQCTPISRTGGNMPGFEIDGPRLRSLRQARGWTQLELAMLAGVSERTVRNAECGRPIRRGFLDFLAGALGVEPIELSRAPMAIGPRVSWERQAQRILEAIGATTSERDAQPFLSLVHPQ